MCMTETGQSAFCMCAQWRRPQPQKLCNHTRKVLDIAIDAHLPEDILEYLGEYMYSFDFPEPYRY